MHYDIAVIGCGPAGCVLSTQLGALGFKVALIARPRRFHAVEGLSERTLKGFEFAHLERSLAAVGPRVRRVATWNGERVDANQEWIVDRPRLDAALLADAEGHDVRVFGGTVRRFLRHTKGWQVAWTSTDRKDKSLTAGYLLDARGRASRRAARDWIQGPATFAIARRYQPSLRTAACTSVVTLPTGWLWFANDGESQAVIQLFVSTAVDALPPRREIGSFFDRQVAAVSQGEQWLRELQPLGAVHARDAATARRREVIGDSIAWVGDAAMAIDPLSGNGIYEAVSGALALTAVINTILRRPDQTALAKRFYNEKLEADFRRLARIGRDFYRTETRWHKNAYWRERQVWPDDEPAHAAPLSGAATIAHRAVSDNGFVCERPVVVTPDHPRGVWQVAGIPLVELHALAANNTGEPGAFPAAAAQRFGVPATSVDLALAWLQYRGMLAEQL